MLLKQNKKYFRLLKKPFIHTAASCTLSLFEDHSESFHHKKSIPSIPKIPISLRDYHRANLTEAEITEQMEAIHKLKLSSDQINYIEKGTKHQSQSLVWKDMIVSSITALVMFDVLHTNMERPSESLINKIFTTGINIMFHQ